MLTRTQIEMMMELKNSIALKTQGKVLQIECVE